MPRYSFDVYDGDRAVRDERGIELGSIDEAAEQAAAVLPDVARDAGPGRESRNVAALVRDRDGAVVTRAALCIGGSARVGGAFRRCRTGRKPRSSSRGPAKRGPRRRASWRACGRTSPSC